MKKIRDFIHILRQLSRTVWHMTTILGDKGSTFFYCLLPLRLLFNRLHRRDSPTWLD